MAEGTHQANKRLPPGRLPLHALPFKRLLGSCLGLWEEGEGLKLLEDSTVLVLEDGNEVPLPAGHLQQLEPEQGWGSRLGDSCWEKWPRATAETTPAPRPSRALSPACDLNQAQICSPVWTHL